MSDDHAAEIDKRVRTYILVFVALAVLTVITVAVAYMPLGVGLAIALALFIATIKGSLVACYFMHLLSEKKLIYIVLAITVTFFFVLMITPVITSVAHRVGS
jgi:cytochrome c oxidase subunit 4